MSGRSLQASLAGINQIKKSLKGKGLTQDKLAVIADCSRKTICSLLGGNPIRRQTFLVVCEHLGLDLEEIVEPKSLEPENKPKTEALVQQVRQRVRKDINRRCNTMRVLDMERPITVDSIYTSVNILEKISRNQRRSIDELLEEYNLENFDRFGLSGRQERILGLEAVRRHDKLLILGKPGAGKTTFLKWLALHCSPIENAAEVPEEGKFLYDDIPVFVTLKEFAEAKGEPTLIKFIVQQWANCRIENAEEAVEQVLEAGQALILLDGLDEVRVEDSDRILDEIRYASERFHANRFVMTCRIAAQEYIFEQFAEVEIADFDEKQIAEFASKWFQPKDATKAAEFPRALAARPNLHELAVSPLLLTLLCLVYEEQAGFPVNRSELYKEGLDLLLKRWDVTRNIKRQEVYQQFPLQRKEELLSQVAFTTFERSEYFFKQKFVEAQIQEYVRSLPNANTDPKDLQLDSEAVLKSIEAQHGLLVERARGIYSFSHLTFQEYFTARQIKNREKSDGDFGNLLSHITEKRWQEIFLLTAGMLENADRMLQAMKCQIDSIVAEDEKLQEFLRWVEQKSGSVEATYKPAAIRAFYLDLARALDFASTSAGDYTSIRARDRARASTRISARTLDLARDIDFNFAIDLNLAIDGAINSARDLDFGGLPRDFACDLFLSFAFVVSLNLSFDPASDLDLPKKLLQELLHLKEQRPSTYTGGNYKQWLKENGGSYKGWWEENGRAWTEQLRKIIIEYRNIGYDWQITEAQKNRFQQYYDANKLIIACLNSDCYISHEVRDHIEATLLLPISSLSRPGS